MISFGRDGVTGHGDHSAVATMTAQAFSRWKTQVEAGGNHAELWQVAVSKTRAEAAARVAKAMKHPFRIAKPIDDERVDIHVDVRAYQQQRRAAFAAHKTQFPHAMQVLWHAFLPVDGFEGFQRVKPQGHPT